MLEELYMRYEYAEQGAVKTLFQSLRKGACPRLHALELPVVFYPYTVDEGGTWKIEDDPNEEKTDLNLTAMADLLEERQRLGTCQAVKDIGQLWLDFGSVETQARLLRLLLPVVKYLPDLVSDFSWQSEHVKVFSEVPAPYLAQLVIPSYAHAPLLDSLMTMTSLKELTLSNGAFDRASFERFISLIKKQDNGGCLPSLRSLCLSDAMTNPENGDLGFSRLFQALEGSACAKSLHTISINDCRMSTDGSNALAALIENGGLPSLESLTLQGNGIGNTAVIQLITSCKAAGPSLRLTTFRISREGMNDVTLQALASALEGGALRRLKMLAFCGHEHITDVGIMHLIEAINNNLLAEITDLLLDGTKITSKGAASLAAAGLVHCPKLFVFRLPTSNINSDAKEIIHAFFRGGRYVYVDFQ